MGSLAVSVFVLAVSFCTFCHSEANSVYRFGDVLIRKDESNFQCDRIICPAGTVRCQVMKFKPDPSSNVLQRRNICFSITDEVLLEDTSNEEAAPGEGGSLNVYVTDTGSISQTSIGSFGSSSGGTIENFDAEAFSKDLQENINRNIQDNMKQLQDSLENTFGRLGQIFGP